MKKALLIFLLFTISNSYSQTDIIDVPKVWELDIWDGTNWGLISQVTYIFNSKCLVIEGLSKVKDVGGSEELENSSFLTISYDTNDLPLESINQLWDENTSTWENHLKTEFTHTATNLTEFINYDWQDNSWKLSNRETKTYNTSNFIVESIEQTWDDTNGIWLNVSKTEYTYNPDNTIHIITTYNWNTSNSIWVNDVRETHIYTSGLLTSKETDTWNTSSWENSRLRHYTYDSNSFLIETSKMKWNGTAFENEDRILRTNNTDGFPTEMITQSWLFGSWLNSTRDRRTYPECTLLSNKKITNSKVNVYPNPAHHEININTNEKASYVLITPNGQIIQKGTLIKGTNTLEISQLLTGIYFINIISKKKKHSIKLAKH